MLYNCLVVCIISTTGCIAINILSYLICRRPTWYFVDRIVADFYCCGKFTNGTSTSGLLHVHCTCYLHFGQHKTTLVVPRQVSWSQNITKNSVSLDPAGKAYLRASSQAGGKEGKKGREGRNDEKGLQCPEFLTWKVGNPKRRRRWPWLVVSSLQ